MRASFRLFLLLCGLHAAPALAQVTDAFSDGDFTRAPAWAGDTARWVVADLDGDPALRSQGRPARDTLYLATPSAVSYGTWRFTFAYRGVNLSNFNGARVFLLADTLDLTGPVRGYYVQLGASNDDQVRLYRIDGDPARHRVELGRSDARVPGDSGQVHLVVTRSADDVWTVAAGDAVLFTARDGTYGTSRYMGLWVKHTEAAADAFYLDDVAVAGTTAPPDRTPPEALAVRYRRRPPALHVTFSEPLDPATLRPGHFLLEGYGPPASVTPDPAAPHGVLLHLARELANGSYVLALTGLADTTGNPIVPGTTLPVTVDEDLAPPALVDVRAVDARRVEVQFGEAVDTATACTPAPYEVVGVGGPAAAACMPERPAVVLLHFGRDLPEGLQMLHVQGVADRHGNVLTRTGRPFYVGALGVPAARDVVVNEIHFAPDDDALEFVELFNRADRAFDLRCFTLADSRAAPVPLTTRAGVLPPGGFAVAVRDSAAFAAAFPGVPVLVPAAWPTLNNGGDAVALACDTHDGPVPLDAVAYLPAWSRPGASLERLDPAGPSDRPSNFGASTATPGATPGHPNSLYAPDRVPPVLRFADQAGPRTLEVFFDEPVDPASLRPEAFRLHGAAADTLIARTDTSLVLTFADSLRGTDLTARAVADLTGNRMAETTVPIARRPHPGDLVLNEILYAPRADAYDEQADQPEYVELFNRAPYPLSLRRLYWTRTPDETGDADTLRLGDGLAALPPGGFAVVFAQPEPVADPARDSRLAHAFPGLSFTGPGTVLLPLPRATLRLRDAPDRIRLHRRDDAVLDDLRYDPAWHHPALLETRGIALERVDPDAPTTASDNWTSSVAEAGGTPGAANALYRAPGVPPGRPGLRITPSPFTPEGGGTTLLYTLAAETALVRVRLFDAHGRLVRTLTEAHLAGTAGRLRWNGRDDAGLSLPIGPYIALLEAVDVRGGTTEAYKAVVVLARAF